MEYIYGTFSDNQIEYAVRLMHSEVHKLLLYKDKKFEGILFNTEEEFSSFFKNLLVRFGGLNELLGEPNPMVSLMSTLQAAYTLSLKEHLDYRQFRRLILDAHGYISAMFEEGDSHAKS